MNRLPTPTRLSTSTVPPCMSTIERTIARPEAAAAAARLVGPRAAVEALEDVRQLGRRRCRRRCRPPRSGPRRRRRRRRRDRAAARRELDRVGRRGWRRPGRSAAGRGGSGSARRAGGATGGRRGAPAAAGWPARRPTRPRRAGRRAAGRAGPARNRASRARAGSGPASRAARSAGAARLEELGARRRVVAGALLEQLVERPQRGDRRPQLVRDVGQEVAAAVAVAADDLDALLEPVRHRVELDARARRAPTSRPDVGGGDALGEVALGEAARRLGQAAERGREAAGHGRGDDHARPERERAPTAASRP